MHVSPLAPVLRGGCNILGAGEIFVPITQVFVISCFAPSPIATYQYWCFLDKAKIRPRMQIFNLLFVNLKFPKESFWAVWKWLTYSEWGLVALCCVLAWGASLLVAGQSSGQSWYITTELATGRPPLSRPQQRVAQINFKQKLNFIYCGNLGPNWQFYMALCLKSN